MISSAPTPAEQIEEFGGVATLDLVLEHWAQFVEGAVDNEQFYKVVKFVRKVAGC